METMEITTSGLSLDDLDLTQVEAQALMLDDTTGLAELGASCCGCSCCCCDG